MTTRLDLEYDGTGFAGWARQPGERAVEEELERALSHYCFRGNAREGSAG